MCSFKVFFGLMALGVIQVHGDDSITSSKFIATNDGIVYEKNLNEAFDETLPKIREIMLESGLDPMSLPDTFLTTSKIPGLKGKIHLQRGWAQELSTIKRTGDVIMQYGNKKMTLDLSLGFDEVQVTYAYTMRYLLYKRKGDFYGRFKNMKLNLLISFDLQERKIDLRYLELTHVGKFTLKLEGHLADFILNILTKIFTTFSRDSVLRNIESQLRDILRNKIEEINDSIPEPQHIVKNELKISNFRI